MPRRRSRPLDFGRRKKARISFESPGLFACLRRGDYFFFAVFFAAFFAAFLAGAFFAAFLVAFFAAFLVANLLPLDDDFLLLAEPFLTDAFFKAALPPRRAPAFFAVEPDFFFAAFFAAGFAAAFFAAFLTAFFFAGAFFAAAFLAGAAFFAAAFLAGAAFFAGAAGVATGAG